MAISQKKQEAPAFPGALGEIELSPWKLGGC